MLIDMEVTPNTKYFANHEDDKMTKASMLVRFLIKICFIPVTVKNEQIVFKIFSCKTFIFITFCIAFNIIQNIASHILIGDKYLQFLNEVRMLKINLKSEIVSTNFE